MSASESYAAIFMLEQVTLGVLVIKALATFWGRIRLERLWEDRVMSDQGDGPRSGQQRSSSSALQGNRLSFDSPIQNMIPSSWEVHASCTRHIASSDKNTSIRCFISRELCVLYRRDPGTDPSGRESLRDRCGLRELVVPIIIWWLAAHRRSIQHPLGLR